MRGRIVLLGGGGHCHVVIDALQAAGEWEIAGILDAAAEPGTRIFGVPVLGTDDLLPELLAGDVGAAAITVGSVGDASVRERLLEAALAAGFELPAIVHPDASVSGHAVVREGAYVAPGAVVCAGAVLGTACIVNTGAVVDHDCRVGELAHIAPGATLSGEVTVGRGAHVGAGVTVSHGLSVGDRTTVGAGSVVVCDMPAGVIAYGCPCKVVRDA